MRAPRLRVEGIEREKVLAVMKQAISTRPALPDYLHLEVIANVERHNLTGFKQSNEEKEFCNRLTHCNSK